ncbi:AfsA-related hotdog domain-containing protein [Arthrobacter sp. Y-9]|uniref:AfsA-related hotdog domain-containing protein n=1 Tax=Arthrobacter sp. Y-9 TaxID=3039385 RepID=UPI00241D99A6|nr:AfsA-related hotdog domain-containing protein [Arthrobacter sp. Y-9]WFR83471.1 AfsA-related hotdog domain-containing protein [Arthrobacter sp. Y-9]
MTAVLQPRSSRTIDRHLVHRRQVHEVFITEVDMTTGWCTAQLPASHSYYGDTAGPVDILGLMEVCRQAVTAAAHLEWKIPFGTHFVLRQWEGSFPLDARPSQDDPPLEVQVWVTLREHQTRRQQVRSVASTVELFRADGKTLVGTMSFDVMFLTEETYQYLRSTRSSGTPAPSSLSLSDTPSTIEPWAVGRTHPDNVLITQAVGRGSSLMGVLRLPVRNWSIFDHPQDHAPAMALTDAARQLVGLSEPSHGPEQQCLVWFRGEFSNYVELDMPAVLSVRGGKDAPAGSSSHLIEIRQSGAVVATIHLGFEKHLTPFTSQETH